MTLFPKQPLLLISMQSPSSDAVNVHSKSFPLSLSQIWPFSDDIKNLRRLPRRSHGTKSKILKKLAEFCQVDHTCVRDCYSNQGVYEIFGMLTAEKFPNMSDIREVKES